MDPRPPPVYRCTYLRTYLRIGFHVVVCYRRTQAFFSTVSVNISCSTTSFTRNEIVVLARAPISIADAWGSTSRKPV